MNQVKSVAIVGGTHGNELTGVYLAKKFQENIELISRPSFRAQILLSNLEAIKQCKRYIDKDLNRCFKPDDLQNPALTSYEEKRAKEIQQILCPQNQLSVDVIIDLHSRTSNIGLSILLGTKHPFLLKLSAYLTSMDESVKVCYSPNSQSGVYLDSLSDFGFAIEVGAILQTNNTLTIYEYTSAIDYSKNARGEIQAMIHPQLQFQDYKPLNKGDLIFLTFAGQEIAYQGEHTVYPIFINSAASI